MKIKLHLKIVIMLTFLVLSAWGLLLPLTATAQEEMTNNINRYRGRESSTGYYEEYEVRPRNQRAIIGRPGVGRGAFEFSPGGGTVDVRIRTHLADSHMGLKFYERRQCSDCHVNETIGHHTVKANLTCRQCHGGEPIASINHYYSPLNPIRRHAYVCAKCHEGASGSFASYIIHEPPAGSLQSRNTFPVLYFTYWFMLVLLMGTLAFFIPHSFLIGIKELIHKYGKGG